jgi:hypothetical protein
MPHRMINATYLMQISVIIFMQLIKRAWAVMAGNEAVIDKKYKGEMLWLQFNTFWKYSLIVKVKCIYCTLLNFTG